MTNQDYTFASLTNVSYIEQLYRQFLDDPDSVDHSWKQFFLGMQFSQAMPQSSTVGGDPGYEVIELYRNFGHLAGKFRPVHCAPFKNHERLSTAHLDPKTVVSTHGVLSQPKAPLSELIARLDEIYCGSAGYQCDLPAYPEVQKWIYSQIEAQKQAAVSHEDRIQIYKDLYSAVHIEAFADKRYPGQTRFSLEGGESLVPMLNALFDTVTCDGANEIVMAMAHRGRVNVLANVLNKSYVEVLEWFHPKYVPPVEESRGDIKYHKGFETDLTSRSGKPLHVSLLPNPSHLESVDPVVLGYAKARQKRVGDVKKVVPLILHGDSAFAGQGVVYEILQLSQVDGYSTGGTIHIIVNNHLGYTATPEEYMSTTHASDLARAFSFPVFHVNSEDPEMCLRIGQLAAKVRSQFGIDVVVNFHCFRRKGHNEGDEPRFTSPDYYAIVDEKLSIDRAYRKTLEDSGNLDPAHLDTIEQEIEKQLEEAYVLSQDLPNAPKDPLAGRARRSKDIFKPVDTRYKLTELQKMAIDLNTLPESLNVHSRLSRVIKARAEAANAAASEKAIDWALSEQLAYATLISTGKPVRLSGQDCGRGTFSHRHATIVDQKTGEAIIPLQRLGDFEVYNSILSEEAVLGFDYGYACAQTDGVVIWEAQFGDFYNGAQGIIDQYISASEQKWGVPATLLMYLPHGMEGMGPEHSSGNIPRFLLLCGDHNMIVACPSTPAQWYHLIRRAALMEYNMPHVIFTPKAPLRFKPSFSSFEDLSNGTFEEVIGEDTVKNPKRVLFCTGKVYYDLLEKRDEQTAIVRIEQLYPLHAEKLKAAIEQLKGFEEAIWVQEEHVNFGAWENIRSQIEEILPQNIKLRYVGRDRSSTPGTGSPLIHKIEREEFINQLFPG